LSGWIFDESWSSGQASLNFRNYSVPKDDPIHNANNAKQLRERIYARIARSHVIVIPTGMYVNYSKWIGEEISGSKFHTKPILAVNPWSQKKNSSIVQAAAIATEGDTVGWNKQPVIDAIWKLYRP
jgi:5-formaminoimidazole-4-carboxamide-1-beta-D-ribofuranosyl 5'-monophosphate synthetase